jgi:hypothetical protein
MINVAEIRITEAVWPEDRAPIARLMRDYVEALEVDISFQDFESEYASLPGKYEANTPVSRASMKGRRVSFCSLGRQTKPSGSSPTAPSNAGSAR